MIRVKVIGINKTIKAMKGIEQKIICRLADAIEISANDVKNTAKKDYLRGPRPDKLGVKSSRLINSIRSWKEISLDGKSIIGKAGTNVLYGKAWEYGFTIPARTIVPKRAKALHFKINGMDVFTKKATIPAKKMAPRPFMNPALNDNKVKIQTRLRKALQTK